MVADVVLPIFSLVLIGYIAGRTDFLDEQANGGLFRYVFYLAIPCLLFDKLSSVALPPGVPWRFICAYYLGTLLSYAIGAATLRWLFGRPLAQQGMAGFATAYSNMALLGIPLVLAAFGDAAAIPLFVTIALHPTLLIPLTAVLVETGRDRHRERRRIPLQVILGILRNPMLIGLLAGLFANLLDLHPAALAEKVVAALGATGGTCALVCLGASLAQYRLSGALKVPFTLIAVKNFVHPLLVWLLAYHAFTLEPLWRHTALVLAVMPTGVNVYLLARHYELMAEDIAKTITLSTLTTTLTVSVLLSVL